MAAFLRSTELFPANKVSDADLRELALKLKPVVGRCTLTPPDPYRPVAERRLVSTLAPVK